MLVGISGKANAGKDALAFYLAKDHGFTAMALADPMKEFVQKVYGFSYEQLWGVSGMRNQRDLRYPREHTYPNSGQPCACCGAPDDTTIRGQCYLTPRYALQTLGTEWGRHCHADTWAHYLIERAWRSPSVRSVVVTDVRFLNEVQALKNAGAVLVRVVRPGAGLTGGAGGHASEIEQNSIPDTFFDRVVVNDGTLEDLQAHARDIVGARIVGARQP